MFTWKGDAMSRLIALWFLGLLLVTGCGDSLATSLSCDFEFPIARGWSSRWMSRCSIRTASSFRCPAVE
ncbi:hypothetical protein DYH09_22230 [bacterium CPR1]|nr:hypothetical protein [bacterium CPR1]